MLVAKNDKFGGQAAVVEMRGHSMHIRRLIQYPKECRYGVVG